MGAWKLFRISREGPNITHVFFADDLVLFTESLLEQIDNVTNYLDVFCEAFGAKVTLQKTKVFFSKNTPAALHSSITTRSGFEEASNLGRYLEVPLFTGRILKLFTPMLLIASG